MKKEERKSKENITNRYVILLYNRIMIVNKDLQRNGTVERKKKQNKNGKRKKNLIYEDEKTI